MRKMKHKISVSIEEETLLKLIEFKRGRFRNRSHAVEFALERLMG